MKKNVNEDCNNTEFNNCYHIFAYSDNKALRDLETELSAYKPQIKYQKAFTVGDGWQQWPTTLGIPLHLNLSNSALMALQATGKATMQPSLREVLSQEQTKARNVEISGKLNPR